MAIDINSLDCSYNASFNRRIVEVLNSNSWSGKRCFILGGGESLRGFDISRLKNEKVIGTNRAFELGNFDINYSLDTSFYDYLKKNMYEKHTQEMWSKFTGYKVFLAPLGEYRFDSTVFLLRRAFELKVNRNLEDGIYGANNSGLGAILLAICLGVTKIFLLGFDMRCDKTTHFHSGYGQDTKSYLECLDRFRIEFDRFAPIIKKTGVDVINLNKDSSLACFEKSDLDKIL